MPPSLFKDSNKAHVDQSEPYYTNEDVAILHDIVVRAQELFPELPERERLPTNALFHAYYEILSSIGIDADHDSRYARVLFKIGGTKGDGSLYDKFETVLLRMGIEIEFDQDGDTKQGSLEEHSIGQDIELQDQSLLIAPTDHPRGRRRRNSESSAPGFGNTLLEGRLSRPRSYSPSYRLAEESQPFDRETAYDTRAWLKSVAKDNLLNSPTRSSTDRASGDQPHFQTHYQRDAGISLSSSFSSQIERLDIPPHGDPKLSSGTRFYGADLEIASEPLINSAATLVESNHDLDLLRRVWDKWRAQALQLAEDNANLDLLARHRDRQILLRQAFELWRVHLLEHQQKKETERFFAHLGRRASRARDLFLLAKAFTHWAQTTSDEVQRTSLARRHILRTRYFKAWREITAVNELKVRRFVVAKFFNIWRAQNSTVTGNRCTALARYEDNLVERTFWIWFWTFCDRRAPAWWADRLKRRQVNAWISSIIARKEDERIAVSFHDQWLKVNVLSVWASRTRGIFEARQYSTAYNDSKLLSKSLYLWQKTQLLQPVLRSFEAAAAVRRKRTIFELWLLRSRQETEARYIDRLRMKREVWIAWTDKIKCRAFRDRISNKLGQQALYKWILSERTILAHRMISLQAKHFVLEKWKQKLNLVRLKESQNLATALQFYAQRKTRFALQQWQNRSRNYVDIQRLSSDFLAPRLAISHFALWRKAHDNIQQLQSWSEDGKFYLLANKTLKWWKGATEKSKREKRRNAYSILRRKFKINLASKVLSQWHGRLSSFQSIQTAAIDLHRNKDVVFTMEIFDRWRAHSEELAELEALQSGLVLSKHLNQWRTYLQSVEQLDSLALEISLDRSKRVCLKVWVRSSLQRRARQHLGLELCEKSMKRTSRKILAHWHQSVLQRRSSNPTTDPRTDRNMQLGDTLRAETWSTFEGLPRVEEWAQGTKSAPNLTPLPGYLSTPLRRSTRHLFAGPSTTPSAPLSSPFERRLRAQYLGRSIASSRRMLGASSEQNSEVEESTEQDPKV